MAQNANYTALVDKREALFDEWLKRVQTQGMFTPSCADDWLQGAAAGGAKFSEKSTAFVHDWCGAVYAQHPVETLDELVVRRAKHNKGKRSALFKCPGESPDWQGMKSLTYRWPTARLILKDIVQGLAC